jgi:hypothetical protein
MLFAVDFDGTVVSNNRQYDDFLTPLTLISGAKQALISLKRAGHTLLLYSMRANRALREDPNYDPLVRAGVKEIDNKQWQANSIINQQRYQEMLDFVEANLPGIFSAIDDGLQGKPSADIYIDDKAVQFGAGIGGNNWADIANTHGEDNSMVIRHLSSDVRSGKYKDFLRSVETQALAAGAYIRDIGFTSVGPILRFELIGDPYLMIVAGQHGEEQAGPATMQSYLRDIFNYAQSKGVGLWVYPCINPEGFASNTRFNKERQEATNTFLDYQLEDGKWVSELNPGEKFKMYRPVKTMSYENRCLYNDLEHLNAPEALIDIHQDKQIEPGQAMAYVDGNRDIFAKIMNQATTPYANKEIALDWTHLSPKTDANGLIVGQHDGCLDDYMDRRGALYSVTLETSLKAKIDVNTRINHVWITKMIDLVAGDRSLRV